MVSVSIIAYSQKLHDNEIKKNVTAINNSLQKLTQLQPRMFEYKTDQYKHLKLQGGTQYGFVAEDFQQVFPELVKEKSTSYMFGKNSYRNATLKTIDELSLIPVLVASIKEQQLQIEKLTSELEILKSRKNAAFAE
jgi:Chaperone of endosialidase